MKMAKTMSVDRWPIAEQLSSKTASELKAKSGDKPAVGKTKDKDAVAAKLAAAHILK